MSDVGGGDAELEVRIGSCSQNVSDVGGADIAKLEVRIGKCRQSIKGKLSTMSSNNGRWRRKAALDIFIFPSVAYNIFGISANLLSPPTGHCSAVGGDPRFTV